MTLFYKWPVLRRDGGVVWTSGLGLDFGIRDSNLSSHSLLRREISFNVHISQPVFVNRNGDIWT